MPRVAAPLRFPAPVPGPPGTRPSGTGAAASPSPPPPYGLTQPNAARATPLSRRGPRVVTVRRVWASDYLLGSGMSGTSHLIFGLTPSQLSGPATTVTTTVPASAQLASPVSLK